MVFIQEGKAVDGSYRLAFSLSDHSGQVRAEQIAAADALQCPLRFCFQARLTAGVRLGKTFPDVEVQSYAAN